MALAGGKLPRNRYTPGCILVPIFPGIHLRYGRHARSHLLALPNIESVLITQLMHISSTGSLVIFSPPAVSASQELIWYGTLWCRVMDRRSNRGKTIRHPPGSLTAIQKRGSADSRLGRLKNAHPRVRDYRGVGYPPTG